MKAPGYLVVGTIVKHLDGQKGRTPAPEGPYNPALVLRSALADFSVFHVIIVLASNDAD
jgi:hypothetical protein